LLAAYLHVIVYEMHIFVYSSLNNFCFKFKELILWQFT